MKKAVNWSCPVVQHVKYIVKSILKKQSQSKGFGYYKSKKKTCRLPSKLTIRRFINFRSYYINWWISADLCYL